MEISTDILAFIAGYSETEPDGLVSFVDVRTSVPGLKAVIDKKYLDGVTRSKARKADWVKAFIAMPPTEKRSLLESSPDVLPLLPRDLDRLSVPRTQSIGQLSKKMGHGSKLVTFDIYSALDVIAELRSACERKGINHPFN